MPISQLLSDRVMPKRFTTHPRLFNVFIILQDFYAEINNLIAVFFDSFSLINLCPGGSIFKSMEVRSNCSLDWQICGYLMPDRRHEELIEIFIFVYNLFIHLSSTERSNLSRLYKGAHHGK